MLIYNRKGQLFLGERYGKAGHWQFPQGGVEARESLRTNVLRELKEEIGISRKQIGVVTKLKARHRYLWKKIPAYARGRWIGQAQTFWLVEFIGEDVDIDLEATDDREFQDWKWCSVTTVRKVAARERIAGYEQALKEFLEFRKKARAKRNALTPSRSARVASPRKR
jgi:putative (di)nucleoside polyphosphate hydrolase